MLGVGVNDFEGTVPFGLEYADDGVVVFILEFYAITPKKKLIFYHFIFNDTLKICNSRVF